MYYFGFKTSHVWLKTYEYYGRTYLPRLGLQRLRAV